MPARSKAQQIAISIAEHHPEKLNPENKGLLNMTNEQMHEFAATPTRGLPIHVPKIKQPRLSRKYYGEKL